MSAGVGPVMIWKHNGYNYWDYTSPFSNYADLTIPAPPTGLDFSPIFYGDGVDVVWNNDSAKETGYHLAYTIDGNAWTTLPDAGADQTSRHLTGLAALHGTVLRLSAFNDLGSSGDIGPSGYAYRAIPPDLDADSDNNNVAGIPDNDRRVRRCRGEYHSGQVHRLGHRHGLGR